MVNIISITMEVEMMRPLILGLSFLLGTICCLLVKPKETIQISEPIVIEEKIEQPKPEPPKPKISPSPFGTLKPTALGLIEGGGKYPGANVCKSKPHPLLMELAAKQANYQASICVQGHQNFMERFNAVQQAGLGHATEICAESWPWQTNDSMNDLGWEMFKCWSQSPGHWSVACKQHKYFGADMAKGRNGVYYACIIVAD